MKSECSFSEIKFHAHARNNNNKMNTKLIHTHDRIENANEKSDSETASALDENENHIYEIFVY